MPKELKDHRRLLKWTITEILPRLRKNPSKQSVKYKAKGRTGLAKTPIWLNWRALEDEGRINIGLHFYKFYSFNFTDKSVPCGH